MVCWIVPTLVQCVTVLVTWYYVFLPIPVSSCCFKFACCILSKLSMPLLCVLPVDHEYLLCVCQVEEDPTGGKYAGAASALNGAPHKLENIIQFHVGDVVTSLQRAVMQPGGQECIMYATIMGAIGMPHTLHTTASHPHVTLPTSMLSWQSMCRCQTLLRATAMCCWVPVTSFRQHCCLIVASVHKPCRLMHRSLGPLHVSGRHGLLFPPRNALTSGASTIEWQRSHEL